MPASGVDALNGVERYAWRIVDRGGDEFMQGIDIVERDVYGHLRRILMFHGALPAAD